jgi:hypothetical protein
LSLDYIGGYSYAACGPNVARQFILCAADVDRIQNTERDAGEVKYIVH